MSPDPADAEGEVALTQGMRNVLSAWEGFLMVMAPVAMSYTAAVALGWVPGDIRMRIVGVGHAMALLATVLAGRHGKVSRRLEVDATLMIFTSALTTAASYHVLCPWATREDMALMVALVPMMLGIVVSAGVSCEIAGMTGLRSRPEYVLITVLALAAPLRCVYDVEARSALQPLLFLLPCSVAHAQMTRSLGAALLESQQRSKDECNAKESAMRGLANSHKALSRVLQAMCNIVMEVDVDLTFRRPTWQLYDLLVGSPGDPQELHGRSLLDFVATEEDAAKLQSFTSGEAEQALGPLAEQSQQGPASVVTIELQDSQGVRFSARLYGACLSGDGGTPSHLLGACLMQDPAAQREAPPPNDAQVRMPWDDVEATPAQIQDMLPRLQRAASIASGSQDDGVEPGDPSLISMRFDAGGASLEFTRGNVLTGSLSESRKVGMLDLISQADARAFEEWVFQQGQGHHIAEASNTVFQPTPFAGELTLKLPKVRSQQVLKAEKAWLQVHEETHNEDVPVTLWLEGVRMLDGSQALAALEEEDEDAASEGSDDPALESISARGSR